jgi:hypothetical protein
MSVRFAPAWTPARVTGWQAGWRGLVCRARANAANDNPGADGVSNSPARLAFDPLLTEALRHFAVHGLGAVDAAVAEASRADAKGDANAKDHWLAITHMFDRRRAVAAGSAAEPG